MFATMLLHQMCLAASKNVAFFISLQFNSFGHCSFYARFIHSPAWNAELHAFVYTLQFYCKTFHFSFSLSCSLCVCGVVWWWWGVQVSRYYLSERTIRLDEYYVLNWPNALLATEHCCLHCKHVLTQFFSFVHNKFSTAIKCLIFNHHAGNSNRCAHLSHPQHNNSSCALLLCVFS